MRLLLFAPLLLWSLADGPAGPSSTDEAVRVTDGIMTRMMTAARGVKDLTCTFYKQERVAGRDLPEEQIALIQRVPHDVHLRWEGDIKKGREVLFRPGWNDDRLRVSLGPLTPNLDLDPRGRMALEGERHSLYDIGPVRLIELMAKDTKLLRARPDLIVHAEDKGKRTVYGETAHCVEIDMPKDKEPALYAHHLSLCMCERTSMPCRAELQTIEDGAMRTVERYGYANLKLNVGLTDADFSPDNPKYGF